MKLNRGGVLLLLASVGAFFSSLLVIQEFVYISGSCVGLGDMGSTVSCTEVTAHDPLKSIGFSSSIAGLAYFIVLFLSTLLRHNSRYFRKRFIKSERLLIHAGTLYMVILTFYHLTFLDKICVYCLAIFLTTILLSISEFYFSSYPYMEKINFSLSSLSLVILISPLLFLFMDLGPDLEKECTFEADVLSQHQSLYDKSIESGIKKGNPDAQITVIEFFDPICGHCQRVYPKLKALNKEYGDKVQFVYMPFLLRSSHLPVHNALYLAAENGKFFKLLDKMFLSEEAQNGLNSQLLMTFLQDLDLASDSDIQKITDGHYNDEIKEDTQNAVDMGIRSTPTFLVNGKKLQRYDTIDQCLENIL